MIDVITKKCWRLFGVFLAVKFISDAWVEIAHGKFELRTHVKTVFQAMMIGVFLAYYKSLLMFFDHFIDSLCVFDQEALCASIEPIQDRLPNYEPRQSAGQSWFSVIKLLAKMVLDFFPKLVALLTHGGAVALMHYIKVIALLVTSQFGPLAALFSLLPGPFKRGFATWAKSYLNITCWTYHQHILGTDEGFFDYFFLDRIKHCYFLARRRGRTCFVFYRALYSYFFNAYLDV